MNKLKTRIAAATALGLLMADAAPLAYAAQAAGDGTAIDRIVTGPVPQGAVLLAQAGGAAAGGDEETEQQRLRRERQEKRKAQQQEQRNQRAQQAAPGDAAEEPAGKPAIKRAQPAEQAPPTNRKAQQPAEQQEEPVIRRVQPDKPADKPAVKRAQPAEQAPPTNRKAQQPDAQPAEPAIRRAQPAQPAVEEGQGQASREERLRQRREALRKLQQQEGDAAEGGATAEPEAPKPPQRAQPATPAVPAEPKQAQPAQPAQPAEPPRQAQPAQPAQPTQPGAEQTEQARPNETDREKRLRERREALRKLQQGETTEGGAAGQGGATVGGGPARQPGATEPPPQQAGQPGVTEGAPENAAPILDSQKPRRGKDGKREIGEGNGTVAPPIARSPTPPPESDEDAQANAPRANELPSVREEEGRRVENRPRRYERPEGADVLREIGSRVILELGNQVLIENTDRSRLTRNAREVYYEELPRGRTRETIVRPNGVTIITIRDRYGEIIRRSRIMPDGREYVLVYVDEDRLERRRRGEWRDPGDDLPPLVISMPYDEYIFDAERVDYDDDEAYYEFLEQPPVEKVERLYSVDEVKRSARVRDSVRRIDLDTITFDTGSAMISEAQVEKLDGVANAMLRILDKNPAETFLIEGHTDAVGSDLSNLALSDERAEAVASALTQVFEIPAENLTTQGYGEQYLKIDTQAAERENRRVAIRRITPLVAPVASAE